MFSFGQFLKSACFSLGGHVGGCCLKVMMQKLLYKWNEYVVMARCWSENHGIGMDKFG